MSGPKRFVAPIGLLVLGGAWLMNAFGIVPEIDWIWTAGLAAAGALTLMTAGLTRMTAVVTPWLMAASACSILRQTGSLPLGHELPILVLVLGVLWLVSAFRPDSFRRPAEEHAA
jgi:hypothetical protein